MKYKLTIALLVTALVLAGGIAEQIYVEKVFHEFSERLEAVLLTEQEDYDLRQIEETHAWWKSKHRALELFLPHVHLNEIEITYGELLGAVRASDHDSAEAQLNRILSTSRAISEMLSLRLGNVF